MKKIIGISLLALSGMASAVAVAQERTHCQTMAQAANAVMMERQKGTPKHQVVQTLKNENAYTGYAKAVVEDAYEQPFFSSAEYKMKRVIQFTNKAYKLCLTTFNQSR
ncbi:hypothetical protein [Vreelandella profundi]|uniref:hypothetical protein n=1 Tax=Vreelandella profundi TaxID=2852117 RepID=UPI001F31A369|nr:hypothetical protein [Halomonas profundi]